MKHATTGFVVMLLLVMTIPLHAQTGWGVERYEGFRASVNNQGNVSQIGWTTGNLGNAWHEGEWVPYCLTLKNVDMSNTGFSDIKISYDFTGGNPGARFVDLVRNIQVGWTGRDYFPVTANNDWGWPDASGDPYSLTTVGELQTAQLDGAYGRVWGSTYPWGLIDLDNSQMNRDINGGLGAVDDAKRYFTIMRSDLIAAGVSSTYTGSLQIYFTLHLSETFIWNLSLQSQLDTPPLDDWGGYVYSLTTPDPDFLNDSRNGSGYVPGASGHTELVGPGSRTVSIPIPPAPFGELSGLKWFDANGNAVKDATENTLDGWEIYVTALVGGIPIQYSPQITGPNGEYKLTGLPGTLFTISEIYQGPT
ncbi:MAG: hypothetical protein JXA28_07530, partial [Bacteroidetes bacterium]|nr:hypothetical protein [Bacteroidota bacterium]